MDSMRETLHATLLSLFSVAYKCRCTLPILVSVGFMLLDVNIRLEFQVRSVFFLFFSFKMISYCVT
jgi:hypothetical protein